MRQNYKRQFVLLVTLWSLVPGAFLLAQTGSKPGKSPIQPVTNKTTQVSGPPNNKSATADKNVQKAAGTTKPDIVEISSELEEILKKWEASSAKIKSLHGDQTRSEINPVFGKEIRTSGKFFLETPDKGRIDLGSVNLKTETSARKGPDEKPYELETNPTQRWICTGDEIVMIDEADKTYSRQEIPESERGSNIVHSPLPFLFGMKAEEAKMRFKLALISSKIPGAVTISAIPLLPKDQDNYEQAWIFLDTKTFLPKAVKLRTQDNNETIYQFKNVVVNDRDFRSTMSKFLGIDKDPYHPNLKGYKLALPPEESSPSSAPSASKPPIKPQGGTSNVQKKK